MRTLIAFILLSVGSASFSQVVVKGRVLGANGKAPAVADVHISKRFEETKKSISAACAKDGSFELGIPNAGMYELHISAVNHEEAVIPLIITDTKQQTIELSATLNANKYELHPERVRLIGDWNKFAFSGVDTLAPVVQQNGKTIYVGSRMATGDTLSYQLLGAAGNHSVNGSQSDYVVYDGGGDYRSVLRTKKGEKVTITYDPELVHIEAKGELPSVSFLNNPFLQNVMRVYTTSEKMRAESIVVSNGAATMSAAKHKELIDYLVTEINTARKAGDNNMVQYASVVVAGENNPTIPFTQEEATTILKDVPAASPYWALEPEQAIALSEIAEPSIGKPYRAALSSNPERTVRAVALANDLKNAADAKNIAEARRLYALLKNEYGDVSQISYQIKRYNPDAVVQVGRSVPKFELTLLGSGEKVSDQSLRGKYYMIDFWATWCGPCVREMPAIHAAYQKFKGKKGFDILSISMDGAETQIAPFQQKKWKMPWMNAFIPGVFEADMAKEFEVAGIPRPILVGPDGNIVAMESELRGEDLEKTLAMFLGVAN